MNNFVQEGCTITLIAPAALSSGDLFQVGNIIAVAVADAESGAEVEGCRHGVFDLSVKAINDAGNSAVAIGEQIYYVAGDTPHLSKKNSGSFAGYALEAVNAGSTSTINVLLTGTPGPGTADILAGAIGTSELANDAVKAAKAPVFVSAEQTGSGAAQDVAHGLAAIPSLVLIVPTLLSDAAAETGFSIVEGVHDDTNVKVTATNTLKYKVMAWA